MHRTVEERVQRGINWLDSRATTYGKHQPVVPTNWRSRLNIDGLMFANPENGPLGQLFGDYRRGLYKMRIVCGGSDLGYRARFAVPGDQVALKEVWKRELRTDKQWNKLGDCLTRVIKGVRFTIYWDHLANQNKPVKVMYKRAGEVRMYTQSYKSYDSAMRAVRKRFNDI